MRSKTWYWFWLSWWLGWMVAGVVVIPLYGAFSKTSSIVAVVLTCLGWADAAYERRKAQLARATARLMAEQLDRLQLDQGWQDRIGD